MNTKDGNHQVAGPVLVVGARGNLGRRVAAALLSRGVEVRLGSRDPSKVDPPSTANGTVVRCDLRDAASVRAAVRDAGTIVHASHGLAPPKRDNDTQLVDGQGVRILIHAAESAGVKRFVFTSAVHASPDHPIDFLRLKHGAEQRLRRTSMDVAIVRPGAFMEFHALETLGRPLRTKGRAPVIGRGEGPRNYVSVDDVAEVVVRLVVGELSAPVPLTIAGPENLTPRQAVEVIAGLLGCEPRIQSIPRAALRVGSVVTRPVAPGLSRLLQFGLYVDAEGDAVDLTPRDDLVIGRRSLLDVGAAWATAA